MEILITLCARAGSKGIPGKNIKPLNGKPLLTYSLNSAKQFAEKYSCHIAISTDDEQVKKIAAELGVHTDYTRPENLATDAAGKIDTIADILVYEEQRKGSRYDYVLDLDITSPLRTIDDLERAFEMIDTDKEALNIFSVNPANKNPYFNMVEKQENGYYGLIKKGNFLTRQSATPVYDMNASFYFYRRAFFDLAERKVINDRSLIFSMDHICFDLDHPIDFEFMSFLFENDKLNFRI
jgi:CMP-N,N'-diacetyllegionaminic acid synthase